MILEKEKEMMLFGLSPERSSFKGVGLFLFIYLGATLFASILTPPAYWAIEWLHSVSPSETTTWLLGKHIDVYYDRLRWAPIILGFPWMMKECGLFSLSNLGMKIGARPLVSFLSFFAFGILLASAIFGLQWAFGVSSPDKTFDASTLASVILSALSGALTVALLEEIIMRGLIMRSFYTAIGPISAVVLSSLFFAYKHFKVLTAFGTSSPEAAARRGTLAFSSRGTTPWA